MTKVAASKERVKNIRIMQIFNTFFIVLALNTYTLYSKTCVKQPLKK